jgi:chemotaxis methyl-accepting protein methylase
MCTVADKQPTSKYFYHDWCSENQQSAKKLFSNLSIHVNLFFWQKQVFKVLNKYWMYLFSEHSSWGLTQNFFGF